MEQVLHIVLDYLGDPLPLILVCKDWHDNIATYRNYIVTKSYNRYRYNTVKYIIRDDICNPSRGKEEFRILHTLPYVNIGKDVSAYTLIKDIDMIYVVLARNIQSKKLLYALQAAILSNGWRKLYFLLDLKRIAIPICMAHKYNISKDAFEYLESQGLEPGYYIYFLSEFTHDLKHSNSHHMKTPTREKQEEIYQMAVAFDISQLKLCIEHKKKHYDSIADVISNFFNASDSEQFFQKELARLGAQDLYNSIKNHSSSEE